MMSINWIPNCSVMIDDHFDIHCKLIAQCVWVVKSESYSKWHCSNACTRDVCIFVYVCGL